MSLLTDTLLPRPLSLPEAWDHKTILGTLTLLLGSIAATSLTTKALSSSSSSSSSSLPSAPPTDPTTLRSFFLFFYSCFLKPHPKASSTPTQQEALENFYQGQATVYDATRGVLLKGREDLLALLAAQLEVKASLKAEALASLTASPTSPGTLRGQKRVWVDIGGGTGYNIEAMGRFLDVPTFFSSVYVVDFSPSLCEVAQKRFKRLGWTNVRVVCEDARKFRLDDYKSGVSGARTPALGSAYFNRARSESGGADLITMSYSLSMIPDYHSVIDSLTTLLAPSGLIGVVDFYAQSSTDYSLRNFTSGTANRHVPFPLRIFWNAWFELDRVHLDPARRDYLEYRFGSVLSFNERNKALGAIPYYVWIGCHQRPFRETALPGEIVDRIDALVTESPLFLPKNVDTVLSHTVKCGAPEIHSKAWLAAIQNTAANLPLPAFFYQNHYWRIYYDDALPKHTQFHNEYIYAFTWEDARVDDQILRLGPTDVVLAITSAGDNILSYALRSPAQIHAVDLNPTQNHLLELKVAAYAAGLPYVDFWKLFGDGKHPDFRHLLLRKLSPHLSSRAFQYWMHNTHVFTSATYGLYDTGGSRHAIRLFRWITRLFGLRGAVNKILQAATLEEQRAIWQDKIRPALLSPFVSRLIVSQESFLWTALGVPKNQLAMIESDHAASTAIDPAGTSRATRSHAIWHYMLNTLDPIAHNTHLACDNPYYYVCMAGQFSPACHLEYQSVAAHEKLSRPHALDNLQIHTDELEEVIALLAPGTLTVAVIMDSMDWFDPEGPAAARQIAKLNQALKMGGRVMLRSSAREPWYVKVFKQLGFKGERVGQRDPGEFIDRVNMYASCWVMRKVGNLPPPSPELEEMGGADMPSLVI